MLFQSGFRFCPLNYDFTSGNLDGSIRIMGNMFIADSLARGPLYNVPIMNFGPCMPYGGVSIPGEMLFGYTLNYMDQQSLANRGTSIFGSNGGLDLTGNIFGAYGSSANFGSAYNPSGVVGYTPWQAPGVRTPGSNPSNSSKKTDAEREAEEKMENESLIIEKVLKAYRDENTDIDLDLKDKINDAIGKSDIKEKYEALKKVYGEIDKDSLKKVFSTMNSSVLINAGFDFTDEDYTFGYAVEEEKKAAKETNKDIKKVYQELSTAEPCDEAFTEQGSLGKFCSVHENDLLELVSAWNEKYNEPDEKLLKLIIDKLPTTDDGDYGKRTAAIKVVVEPLVLGLTGRADDLVAEPDGMDIKPLDRQITKLSRALKNFANDSRNEEKQNVLIREFDVLYVMLRKYEAQKFDKKIANDYKLLNELNEDDQMEINNNIMNATVADLESEGLDDIEFEVRVTRSNSGTKFTKEEIMENLAEDKYAVQKVEVEGVTYYVELEVTGDRTTRRAFAVVGDDIKVVGEYDKTNNTITKYSEENQSKVTANSIEKDYERAIDKREEKEAANENGQAYMNSLSNGNSALKASDAFANVSENNIIQLLDGIYNAESGNEWWRTRGFFLRGHRDGSINFEKGKKIIEAVLDKATKSGFDEENNKNYKKLKNLHAKYEKGTCDNFDKKTFKRYTELYNKCRVIDIFNGGLTEAGIIDECIEALYKDIKKQEKKQARKQEKQQGNQLDIPNG